MKKHISISKGDYVEYKINGCLYLGRVRKVEPYYCFATFITGYSDRSKSDGSVGTGYRLWPKPGNEVDFLRHAIKRRIDMRFKKNRAFIAAALLTCQK